MAVDKRNPNEFYDTVVVGEEELFEFEYAGFSLFWDPENDIWFLETDGDDEDAYILIVEDKDTEFSEVADFLKDTDLNEESFLKLRKFILQHCSLKEEYLDKLKGILE